MRTLTAMQEKMSSRRDRCFAFIARSSFRTILFLSLGLGFAVSVPGIWTGLFVDDYAQVAVLEGKLPIATSYDLFRFHMTDPVTKLQDFSKGPMPWWTLPELRLGFFRPLSSALIVADHALFGHWHIGSHLDSILWYLALIGTWGLLLRRIVPAGPSSPAFGTVAALALIIFSMNEANWFPVLWLANRNALVSTMPVLLGILAHIRWREDRWIPGLPLSLLGYAVGLSGGETAVGVMAYLAAYECFAGPGKFPGRLMAALPAVLVGAVYFAAYRALGYGAFGSGSYIDPVSEPLAYLAHMPGRILGLLAGVLLHCPADLWVFQIWMRPVLAGVGLCAVLLFAYMLRVSWPAFGPAQRRALKWLIPGIPLALLPVASTFPASRLLLVSNLGASLLVASLLVHWWESGKAGVRQGSVFSGACWYLAVVSLVIAPVVWPLQSAAMTAFGHLAKKTYLSAELDDARVAGQRAVLLVAPDPLTCIYPPIIRLVGGRPVPRAWLALSTAPHDHRITRTAGNRLEVEVLGGSMLETQFEQLMRSPSRPLLPGQKISLGDVTVTVLETKGAGPTKVAFEFDRPLEDPSLCFLVWKNHGLRKATLPDVGGSMVWTRQHGVI
jgi:hypothetical protein